MGKKQSQDKTIEKEQSLGFSQENSEKEMNIDTSKDSSTSFDSKDIQENKSDSDMQMARQSHDKRREYLLAVALMAISIAMTVVGAYISIPIGTIKITLQFLVTNTVCLLLGKKWGGLAIWIYILMGLLGLPIFSEFSGGIGYVLKPSFGFLIGFAVGGQVSAFIREKVGKDTFACYFVSSLIGLLVLDIIGTVYGAVIMYGYLHSSMSVWKFFVAFLLPFIPIDILKCVISSLICTKVYKFVKISRK